MNGADSRDAHEPAFEASILRKDPSSSAPLSDESRKVLRTLSRSGARSGRLSPLSYYLTISHEHRFVWFRVAKAGTRTVLGYLDDQGVSPEVPRAKMRYPTALVEDYVKFAFVRHPVDRFLSAWQNKVVDGNYFGFDERTHARMQSLGDFVHWTAAQDLGDLGAVDQHLALQSRLVDLSQVDHLGRLETFEQDLARVLRAVGLPVAPASRRNITVGRRPTRSTVEPEVLDRLAEIYRRDFEILGYPVAGE